MGCGMSKSEKLQQEGEPPNNDIVENTVNGEKESSAPKFRPFTRQSTDVKRSPSKLQKKHRPRSSLVDASPPLPESPNASGAVGDENATEKALDHQEQQTQLEDSTRSQEEHSIDEPGKKAEITGLPAQGVNQRPLTPPTAALGQSNQLDVPSQTKVQTPKTTSADPNAIGIAVEMPPTPQTAIRNPLQSQSQLQSQTPRFSHPQIQPPTNLEEAVTRNSTVGAGDARAIANQSQHQAPAQGSNNLEDTVSKNNTLDAAPSVQGSLNPEQPQTQPPTNLEDTVNKTATLAPVLPIRSTSRNYQSQPTYAQIEAAEEGKWLAGSRSRPGSALSRSYSRQGASDEPTIANRVGSGTAMPVRTVEVGSRPSTPAGVAPVASEAGASTSTRPTSMTNNNTAPSTEKETSTADGVKKVVGYAAGSIAAASAAAAAAIGIGSTAKDNETSSTKNPGSKSAETKFPKRTTSLNAGHPSTPTTSDIPSTPTIAAHMIGSSTTNDTPSTPKNSSTQTPGSPTSASPSNPTQPRYPLTPGKRSSGTFKPNGEASVPRSPTGNTTNQANDLYTDNPPPTSRYSGYLTGPAGTLDTGSSNYSRSTSGAPSVTGGEAPIDNNAVKALGPAPGVSDIAGAPEATSATVHSHAQNPEQQASSHVPRNLEEAVDKNTVSDTKSTGLMGPPISKNRVETTPDTDSNAGSKQAPGRLVAAGGTATGVPEPDKTGVGSMGPPAILKTGRESAADEYTPRQSMDARSISSASEYYSVYSFTG